MGDTCAGIDQIIHSGCPSDLDSYIQETGHNGCYGLPTMGVLSHAPCTTRHVDKAWVCEYALNSTNCWRDLSAEKCDNFYIYIWNCRVKVLVWNIFSKASTIEWNAKTKVLYSRHKKIDVSYSLLKITIKPKPSIYYRLSNPPRTLRGPILKLYKIVQTLSWVWTIAPSTLAK